MQFDIRVMGLLLINMCCSKIKLPTTYFLLYFISRKSKIICSIPDLKGALTHMHTSKPIECVRERKRFAACFVHASGMLIIKLNLFCVLVRAGGGDGIRYFFITFISSFILWCSFTVTFDSHQKCQKFRIVSPMHPPMRVVQFQQSTTVIYVCHCHTVANGNKLNWESAITECKTKMFDRSREIRTVPFRTRTFSQTKFNTHCSRTSKKTFGRTLLMPLAKFIITITSMGQGFCAIFLFFLLVFANVCECVLPRRKEQIEVHFH